jgi:hypothetical protein
MDGTRRGPFTARLTITDEGLRFRAPAAKATLLVYMGFVFALGAGGLVGAFANPQRRDDRVEEVALIAALLLLGALMLRVARSATLLASRSGVVTHSLLRTRHWSWGDLASFEEVVQPIGAGGVPRRFPRAHLAAGGFRNLTELNDSRRRDPDVVAELVRRLNELKQLRGS